MAYVNPSLRPRLDQLSPQLRQAVLDRGVALHTLYDLIGVLNALIREQDAS